MPHLDPWDIQIISVCVLAFLVAVASLVEFFFGQYNRIRDDHKGHFALVGGLRHEDP